MKIPIHLIANGVTVIDEIIYFTPSEEHATLASYRVMKWVNTYGAFGQVHLKDAIVYWCKKDELSPRIFKESIDDRDT